MADGVDVAPGPDDLAVLVISPSDMAYGVLDSIDACFQAGFGEVWSVYPMLCNIVIHRADGSVSKLGPDDELTTPALPRLRCRVAELFPR